MFDDDKQASVGLTRGKASFYGTIYSGISEAFARKKNVKLSGAIHREIHSKLSDGSNNNIPNSDQSTFETDQENSRIQFCDNSVTTSKYTLLTFIPR
jgi:hypothetical protein